MKKILKTYKFRIYPTKANKCHLNKTFGCSRFVYNSMLHEIKNGRKRPTEAQLKKTHTFLKDVDSIALQQSRINIQRAFKNLKEKRACYPKFKSRKSRQSFRTVPTNGNIKINFENNTLKLPKLSPIKFRDQRTFEGTIKEVTVSKDTDDKYYSSILVEEEICDANVASNKTLGIDMGVAHIVTLSNGVKIVNPKFFVSLQRKLRKAQKMFSKTKKGSKRRERLRLRVAIIHKKIYNCRKDFLNKLSSLITKNFDKICIEDLNLLGMLKNRRLSKSLQDLGWSKFAAMLEYKCDWSGKTFLKAGKFFPSSKLCSSCGFKHNNLKLSERVWTCSSCGACHDRDINASLNLKEYLHSTLGMRGSGLSTESAKSKASGDGVGLKLAFASNAIVYETRSPVL